MIALKSKVNGSLDIKKINMTHLIRKILIVFRIVTKSLPLLSQPEYEAKQFIWKHFVYAQSFGGYPESKPIADSICDILDSIGVARYEEMFKKKEKTFVKDLDRLLSFAPKDTDSTNKYLQLCRIDNSYYFLKLHTKELLPYCYDLTNYSQRKMLSLLDISPTLKDSLLRFYKWDDCERARLGDTIAENKLIARFSESLQKIETPDDLYDVIQHGHRLLATGTIKSLKAYISAFDRNKVLEITEGKYMTSLLSRLIVDYTTFFDYYPQYCLLSPAYFSCHKYSGADREMYYCWPFPYEEHYIEQIEKFCLDEFGVELHINIPFFNLEDYEWGCGWDKKKINQILERFK